jgi:putative aldouronate transport system permease protein
VYKSHSLSGKLFDWSNTIFMIFILIVMTFPFIYILSYSLSDPTKLSGGLLVFPRGFTLASYHTAFSDPGLLHAIFISIARTLAGPTIMIFVTSMGAYVITRDELVGVKLIRKLFVFTMYFSSGLIPMYLLIKSLHLTGTFWVYPIPAAVSVFNMILIKTYVESIPDSLEESALIDGANDFILFWRIVFPLCTPVVAAVILFAAVEQWNSFIDTQIYNPMNPEYFTLQYSLFQTLSGATSMEELKNSHSALIVTPQSLKMAITMITVLPIAFVYPFLQKHFTKGLLIGSIKG